MWFARKKKPPQNTTQQAIASPISRFNPFALAYERKEPPSPGAQNYAYEALGLVEFTPIGAGVSNRRQLHVFQPSPLYVLQAVPLQGLGGLQQGQWFSYPLDNPESDTFG